MAVQVAWHGDGRQLHLQHGPIDLMIGIDAPEDQRRQGFAAAQLAFDGVLESLVAELPLVRTELVRGLADSHRSSLNRDSVSSVVAKRMIKACLPLADFRLSPMAAVAGSVADHVLESIVNAANVSRAWVNNGGDIALYLQQGTCFDCAVIPDPHEFVTGQTETAATRCRVSSEQPVAGIATSGRHGRSLSLGIADAVTVLASTAAMADAAATLIANSVDLPRDTKADASAGGQQTITRLPACEIDVDSDLGTREVVTDVAPLSMRNIEMALQNGADFASQLVQRGLVVGVFISLQGISKSIGDLSLQPSLSASVLGDQASVRRGLSAGVY